jgi:hypothetical protein
VLGTRVDREEIEPLRDAKRFRLLLHIQHHESIHLIALEAHAHTQNSANASASAEGGCFGPHGRPAQ